jgi:hypothetical protein
MLAQGIVISISQDGTTYEEIGCITSYTLDQPARSQIDTTCLSDTDSKKYKLGLREPGTMSIDLEYEPQSVGQEMLEASYASSESYRFKIEYTDAPAGGTPTIKEFNGMVMSITENGAIDDKLTESVEIQLASAITVTDPAPAP